MEELTIGTADGRSLTVYDAGDPDGRPILFHHGTPSSGVPFDPHVELAREQGVRLLSYDRAGLRRLDARTQSAPLPMSCGTSRRSQTRSSSSGSPPGGSRVAARTRSRRRPVSQTASSRVAAAASIAPPDRPELNPVL